MKRKTVETYVKAQGHAFRYELLSILILIILNIPVK